MKQILTRIDIFSIITIVILAVGISSSFLDFGSISVFYSVIMPLIFVINCALAIYGIYKKKYLALIGVILFLLFYNFFFQFSLLADSETKDYISVLTYNTREFNQSLSKRSNKNTSTEIIKFIDSLNPDILVFQEASYRDDAKLKEYPYSFIGYRDDIVKSLLIIYSKYPIVNKGYIDFSETKNNAIYADIKIQQDTIRIYNSHLQSFVINQHMKDVKHNDHNLFEILNKTNTKQIEQAKQLKNHAQNYNKKVIICGDFNATPFSNTYRILKNRMKDSYLFQGKRFGKTYSLFHYPLRIDYFLYDDQIKVFEHQNFNLNLSDHEPVFVKFTIK
jgi:endonuclease/exonuclease/phosphatase (EEP) superfamily protein YafD